MDINNRFSWIKSNYIGYNNDFYNQYKDIIPLIEGLFSYNTIKHKKRVHILKEDIDRFLLEGKYKSMDDPKFLSLVKKILSMYSKQNTLEHRDINDLTMKLYTYYDDDLHNNQKDYPFDPFNKKQFPKITDMIHYLDSLIGKMTKKRGYKDLEKVNENDIPIVFKDDEHGITVYKPETAAQSIKLGRGTTFCISADSEGNRFYDYMFDSESGEQTRTTYFIYMDPPDNEDYSASVLHYSKDGDHLFTDRRNDTKFYSSLNKIYNYVSNESNVLNYIPKEVFKFVEIIPDKLSIEKYGKWSLLVLYYPDEIPNYINKLNKNNWYYLYSKNPELIDEYPQGLNKLDNYYWSYLYPKYPELIDKYPQGLDKLDYGNWDNLFSNIPDLMQKYPKVLDKLNTTRWFSLYSTNQDLMQKYPQGLDKLNRYAWSDLYFKYPELITKYPQYLYKLEGNDWYYLYSKNPDLIDKHPQGLDKLNTESLNLLLEKVPNNKTLNDFIKNKQK